MGTKKRNSLADWFVYCCSAVVIASLMKCSVQCIKVIDDFVVYGSSGSPYIITDEILIEKRGNLILEPGITLQFEPGVGITVRGILTAKGTEDRRIILTSVNPPIGDFHSSSLRLIDGPSPTRGRLQMFYKDKWRSVCSNSKNWTDTDRAVACHELGFTGGFFYDWQDRPNNDTATLLYEAPSCLGQETSISKCAWQTHAVGGGVCDMHPDMGLACSEFHSLRIGTNHWKGILFEDAKYTEDLAQDATLFRKVSQSTLEYATIEYAGMGPKRELTAAIQSRQVPPSLRDVIVRRNAFTGVNFTLPDTFVNISHCFITENRGIGLYVNSSVGSVYVEDRSVISDNYHDGIKFVLHPKEPDVKNSEQFLDFCSGATNRELTYPLITVAKQVRYSFQSLNCQRTFYNPDPNFVYTVHFNFAEVDVNDTSSVEVRDKDENGQLLTQFPVRNYTTAPSVVSKTNSIFIRFRAIPKRQVVMYMQLYASKYKIPDIVVNSSMIERNMGHGVSVDNMRSLVLVHKSNLTDNIFGSGLSIRGGAGAVNITYSTIRNNIGDGVNITYEGGVQNVTWSTISHNVGRGMAIWYNESGLDTKIIQETAIAYSTFEGNLDVGILVGNFCRSSFVNVSTNRFEKNEKAAVQFESCWLKDSPSRNFYIGHNLFVRNERLAILVSPAVNMDLNIEWNELHENKRGTIKIYNENIVELEILPSNTTISENTFTYNSGLYVMLLTLNLRGLDQSMLATRNTVKSNFVSEAYPSIMSRSKASGVICIGSFNVKIFRNLIENPDSLHELSSHAYDQTAPINASYNWLGKKAETDIFERVFDRRDRYNLAVIEFHPFLLSDNNVNTPVTSPPQYTEPSFFNPRDNTMIGGEVNGNVLLPAEYYYVVRDIYVQHTGILSISFGTTLEFAEGVGMMITGILRTEGSDNQKVRFTLVGTTEKEKIKVLIDAGYINDLPDNMTSPNVTVEDELTINEDNATQAGPDLPIKLVGGRDEMEGRLMVYTEGIWGTVCNHGWTEDAAAIACQQMGYVLNPEDWFLELGEMPFDGSNSQILASNVRCDEFDTELLQCKFDPSWELENSCNHRNDVGLRCYPRTWAGIRFGMTAKESHVKGVIIEKAGLLDYTKRQFKPALQVDFNQHVLQELIVQDNSQDGIGIIRNNQFAISNPEARLLNGCLLRRNRRHGITFTQPGANITNSRFTDNKGSGLHFNPYISREQQTELTGWMKLRQEDFIAIDREIPSQITIQKDKHVVFITKNFRHQPNTRINFTVSATHTNVIGIQILNPISNISTEQISIYDYPEIRIGEQIFVWDLHKDLSVFPTTSSSYAITFQYNSGQYGLGDTIIVVTAVEKRNIAENGDLAEFRPKPPVIYIEDSIIARNRIGISTLHYNRYMTDDGDHLLRNSNQTFAIIRSVIADNSRQALYCLSPFRAKLDNDRIGEIKFMFNHSSISRNGRGIDQFSWDVRESNNLFHWIFDNITMNDNGGGGVALSLPYVWQYNENFTHTVYVNKSRFMDNADFEFTIDGHFARVNITKSIFEHNVCSKGILAVKGMEKEMFIRDNIILNNVGVYMVEFNADSQSEILGDVLAYFVYNKVQFNRHPPQPRHTSDSYLSASIAIAIRGLQKINITYNLLGHNEMDYEMLGGLFTARLDNKLNVRANWWGSKEVPFIRERIFDFDDWNNYAEAVFRPFLTEGSFNAILGNGLRDYRKSYIEEDTLGGRITEDLLLKRRSKPYIVRSDLTIMPDVTLRIEPGVVIEFFPSVGILVLGKLEAIGSRENRILMRAVNINSTTRYRVGRQVHRQRKIDIRLCIEGNCEGRRAGFLDIFNATTQQWVPICDNRFSERNAQVVCNQLGFNRVNVFNTRDKRTEMFPNALTRIRSWPEPIQCRGMESRLDECLIRMNGQIYDHQYECSWNQDFVYISCGDLNLPSDNYEYWGGIRFSIPDFEYNNLYDRIHDINMIYDEVNHYHHTHERIRNPSVLAWVDIIGAGILHNEKSPAVLSFFKSPKILDVSVTNSAYDGISFVSSHDTFQLLHSRFENNLGVGLSLIGLTGETRETTESSFTPVEEVRLPYHMFGMVDMCDTTKELLVEERLLLYYKYDNKPIDCVKIFSSVFDVKKFGFRLLQFNLFNSTLDPMVPDRIILYDGDIYNETTKIITEINASTKQSMIFFKTRGTRMSVQIHATGASGIHGFVAEIITLPISTIGLDRDLLHNITYNQFYHNQEGAIFALSVGEVNPSMVISWNRIEENGLHLYANITTTEAAIRMDLQNIRSLYFKNNLVKNNTGGLKITAGSNGSATKLWANITNNLFEGTIHRPALYIESKKKSAYQKALIANNDFSWSNSPYHDVITLAQIVSDFSYNYVHSNLGRHILDVYGFQKVRLPVYQTTSHNSFSKNRAVDPTYPGTIVAGSAGQQYVGNVFYNLDNAYELVAVNETVSGLKRSDVWKTPIDARGNWWGFNTSVAVSGRIHDKLDDETLLKVNYQGWALNNYTLLQGCEPGYHLIEGSCYLYVGAPITFYEAKDFCKRDNASFPFLQRDYNEVRRWIKRQQPEYQWDYDMVWVAHYDYLSRCTAFVNYRVRAVNCDLNLPFICESDSDDEIDASVWISDSLVIGSITAIIACFLLVIACLSCWGCKSRQRRHERIIRRNSIRASIRSNRSVLSTTSGGFSDYGHRRRIIEEPNRTQAVKGIGATSNGHFRHNGLNDSFNSIAKSNLNYSVDDDPSYVVYETTQRPHNNIDTRFAHDPDLENQNVNMTVKPSFDLAYQNRAFRDNSTFASADPSMASRELSDHIWTGSNSNIIGLSSPYSTFNTSGSSPSKSAAKYNMRPLVPPPVLRNKRSSRVPVLPLRPPPQTYMSYDDIYEESSENDSFLPNHLMRPKSMIEKGTPSSFRDRSIGGSTAQLEEVRSTSDTTAIIHDDPPQDIHMAATLPRDAVTDIHMAATLPRDAVTDIHMADTLPRELAPSQRFVSADVLSSPRFMEQEDANSFGSPINLSLSQSQPLETAM